MLKILVVDDEPELTTILSSFFKRKKYEVFTANNGERALDVIRDERPHLVFLDIRMPVMDGLTVLRNIRLMDNSIKVIMVSALEDDKTMTEARALGAVDYIRKPFNLDYLEKNVLEKVNAQLFGDLRQELDEKSELISRLAQEVDQVSKLNKKLKVHFYQTIMTLAAALEARDKYTHGHSERVEAYSKLIAEELCASHGWDMDGDYMEQLHIEARMHDIGKMGIPDSVLNKPGGLTDEEFKQIQEHPAKSAQILVALEDMKENVEVILHHHERYDGKGYPDGIKGGEIPARARIIAAADAFDAMTSDRPYRKALSFEIAIEEMEKNKGIQFDPQVIDAFMTVIKSGKLNPPQQ